MSVKKEQLGENDSAPQKEEKVLISAPRMFVRKLRIRGTSPLVIHRFSAKTKEEMKQKMESGKPSSSKRTRKAKETDVSYLAAKYMSKQGWEGFNAAALRNAMISACRLVDYKMTLAKLSIFIVEDGRDKDEPQFSLIRIFGKSVKQEDMARTSTGQPYVTVRAAYPEWYADVAIRFDADQFSLEDVVNLLMRVGKQVGICEGRPDSKRSAGMGWGLFDVEGAPQ